MKRKALFIMFAMALLVGIPVSGYSALVYEKFDDITDTESFFIDLTDYLSYSTYTATIADISESPVLGFENLYMAIYRGGTLMDSVQYSEFVDNQGTFPFIVDSEETYRAYIIGIGGGDFNTGLFRFTVASVPVPATVLLLGSGLVAVTALRRRKLQ